MSKIVKKAMDDYFDEYERKREAKYPTAKKSLPPEADAVGFGFPPNEWEEILKELEKLDKAEEERDNE